MNAAAFGWRYIRLYEHAIKHNKTQKRSWFSTDVLFQTFLSAKPLGHEIFTWNLSEEVNISII